MSAMRSAEKPHSANAASVPAPGSSGPVGFAGTVRLKRGAGPGWLTPSISIKVPRAAMCGCVGASAMSSTGETQASVIARVKAIIADTLISVEPTDSARTDPSRVSDINSGAYRLVEQTIRGMLPGEQVPVLPYLVMGGTDAKYWGAHSDRVFRFLALPLAEGDQARLHGVNERIAVGDYAVAVGFFTRLLREIDAID